MCIFKSFIDFFSYKNKKNQNPSTSVYGLNSLTDAFGYGSLQPIILSLETGVPKYKTLQSDALQYLLSNYKNNNNITYQTIVKNIYKNSRIETRYLGIPDFMENMENMETNFFKNTDPIPIQIRLNKFKEIVIPLVIDICSRAASCR